MYFMPRTTRKRDWYAKAREDIREEHGWYPTHNRFNVQNFVPETSGLDKKLGVAKGSKILFFAGFAGDWASALGSFSNVRFTDINRDMIKHAKAKIEGQVESFKRAAAETVPQRKNIYDWSFSFEPYPLLFRKRSQVTLMRGLLNKKGIKLVFAPGDVNNMRLPAKFVNRGKQIADIYGVSLEERIITVDGRVKGRGEPKPRQLFMLTLRTNAKVRDAVHLDFRLLRLLDRMERKGIAAEEIAKRLRVSLTRINASLDRINQLGRLKDF
jgi:hypothetical protein